MSESNEVNENTTPESSEFVGLLARFEDPQALVEGCNQARIAGYKKMDAFSPFPVHGIDDAIGIRKTRLPLIVFCVGLAACGLGVLLQFYTNGYTDGSPVFPGYPFKISGKPMYSLPANIPVIFEVIVLLSAFAAFFGMWILNGLPKLANPLFRHQDFRRSTSDGFFLLIEKGDGSFNESSTQEELRNWGAVSVDRITNPNEELHVPGFMKLSGLIVAALLLVPPVVIYRAQYTKNPLPRMHVNPDMDRQFRGETQDASPVVKGNPLFADDRVMRKDPVGTIARGDLAKLEDSVFFAGVQQGSPTRSRMALVAYSQEETAEKTSDAAKPVVDVELDWIDEFPPQIKRRLQNRSSGMALYERGKQRFDVYCSVCHGYAGFGDGHVSKRGMALNLQQKAEWVQAKSLFDPKVMSQPVGRIFDTITNGRGAMGPYRSQIPAEDRWAIIVFVKAMHLSRFGEMDDIPEEVRIESWDQVNPVPPPQSESDADGQKEEPGSGVAAPAKSENSSTSKEKSTAKEPAGKTPSGEPGK